MYRTFLRAVVVVSVMCATVRAGYLLCMTPGQMEKPTGYNQTMIAIMTVTGVDNTGIISAVSTALAELNVNIVDVSQTLMSEYFTMILRVEFDENEVSIQQLQERMNTVGESIKQSIRVQSEALFTAMNEI